MVVLLLPPNARRFMWKITVNLVIEYDDAVIKMMINGDQFTVLG